MSTTFASMQVPNFRLWTAGALVANVGTWMQRVAQDWLVLVVLTQNSGVAVGVVTALQFGPALVLSAWAGVLADRVDRRKLLMLTQGTQGLLAVGLGALVLTDTAELWHVYGFALALGTVSAIDGPARSTFVVELVPREKLANAVSLNSANFNLARLIGPGVAGLMIAWVGTGWVFIINGVSFAATIAAVLAMDTAAMRREPRVPKGKGQIRAGVRYVRGRTDILVILVVIGVVSTFGLNFQLTSALMARVEFEKGAGEYGVLGSILAIGSLAGALLAARRERPRVRLVVGSAFAFGVTSGVLALMPTYTSFAIACIPVGLCTLTLITAANSTIQMTTSPAMRGRVMSIYMLVFLGAAPIGSPFVGWVGETYGPRWSIGIGAIAAILVSIGAAIWVRRNWGVEVRYSAHSRPRIAILHPEELPDALPKALPDTLLEVPSDTVPEASSETLPEALPEAQSDNDAGGPPASR